MPSIVILGATGQVGRMLARVWPTQVACALWQHRPYTKLEVVENFPGEPVCWDILEDNKVPTVFRSARSMIVLAGVMAGNEERLSWNTDLALAAVRAARKSDIQRILVASSQAVYAAFSGLIGEEDACQPSTPYGEAKYQMECAMRNCEEVTCLRIGNVAGADALFRTAARQSVLLDRFDDGSSPRRSYIGPMTLAKVLVALCKFEGRLPKILNIAEPGALDMASIMKATRANFTYRKAPPEALRTLEMNTSRLCKLVDMTPANPYEMVAEARAGGWQSFHESSN